MVILFSFPVLLSTADTLRMPLASMSKVTSIWGTPLGAGGIPVSSNLPKILLSLVIALSPSKTWKELLRSNSDASLNSDFNVQEELGEFSGTSRLHYLNEYTGLVVWICGKGLGLLGGNSGVSFDKDSHHSSSSLNSQGQGRDIQQEQVLHILRLITSQYGCLHSCVELGMTKGYKRWNIEHDSL